MCVCVSLSRPLALSPSRPLALSPSRSLALALSRSRPLALSPSRALALPRSLALRFYGYVSVYVMPGRCSELARLSRRRQTADLRTSPAKGCAPGIQRVSPSIARYPMYPEVQDVLGRGCNHVQPVSAAPNSRAGRALSNL